MYLRHNALLPRFLPPHHGVGLPCPRLPIGKDAHIVAFESMQQHLLSNVSIHLLLRCKLWILHLGEREAGKTGVLDEVVLGVYGLSILTSQ